MIVPTASELSQWRKISGYYVQVTPEMARAWLTGNIDNRHIRRAVVARYAEDMRAGRWRATHQGIAFSKRRLIDGQHRLLAVIETGEPQWMVVYVEQPDETFAVLDHGTNRSLRDELRLDSRIVDPAAFIASRIFRKDAGGAAFDACRVLARLQPALEAILAASGTTAKARSAAPFRAVAAIRWASARASDRDYISDQWRAWLTFDFDTMSPAIRALVKRLDGPEKATTDGGNTADFRAYIGWVAFDPYNRAIKRIVVRDTASIRAEIAECFNRLPAESETISHLPIDAAAPAGMVAR